MSSSLLTELRNSRKSPTVLKARIMAIRSRERVKPIFVFEGTDDIGPYSAWVGRCDDSIEFEPLPANGKDQILLYRQTIILSENHLRDHVYFFLDRDFDDLKGYPPGNDVFLTEMYSIENYLVSECVFKSILSDELRCAGEQIVSACALFHKVMCCFFESMAPANRRLFYARRLSIGLTGSGIENKITKYVAIKLKTAHSVADFERLKTLIPLEKEPELENIDKIDREFNELPPSSRHRGKFILAFFLRWLEILAEERTDIKNTIFTSSAQIHFSSQQLSMRSLATRSKIPQGLSGFLERVKTDTQSPSLYARQ